MEKNIIPLPDLPFSLFTFAKFYDSFKSLFILSEHSDYYYTKLKTVLSPCKRLSSHVFEFCYNHPVLTLSGTGIACTFYALHKTGRLPITQRNLINLHKRHTTHLETKLKIFAGYTQLYCKQTKQHLETLIDTSCNDITACTHNLTDVEQKVNELPHEIAHTVESVKKRYQQKHDSLVEHDQEHHKQTLGATQLSLCQTMKTYEEDTTRTIKSMIQLEEEIVQEVDTTLKTITDLIESESEKQKSVYATLHEQQQKDVGSHHAENSALLKETSHDLVSLSQELSLVLRENTIDYTDIENILQQQEQFVEQYSALTKS